jgi:hypothetical protein
MGGLLGCPVAESDTSRFCYSLLSAAPLALPSYARALLTYFSISFAASFGIDECL